MSTTDRHSRPTTTLAAEELRRLAREDETPSRLPKISDAIRRERLDTPTTQMSAIALDELLAAEPRTSPAVIARELRHDTITDPGAKPTTALDPPTVAAREAAPMTASTAPLAPPVARPPLPSGPSVRLPFLIAGIAGLALAGIALLR